jgi:hypothetical protein
MIKKMVVFWVVAPCSLVEVYQRFRGPWCFHHQGNDPLTTLLLSFFSLLARLWHVPSFLLAPGPRLKY